MAKTQWQSELSFLESIVSFKFTTWNKGQITDCQTMSQRPFFCRLLLSNGQCSLSRPFSSKKSRKGKHFPVLVAVWKTKFLVRKRNQCQKARESFPSSLFLWGFWRHLRIDQTYGFFHIWKESYEMRSDIWVMAAILMLKSYDPISVFGRGLILGEFTSF